MVTRLLWYWMLGEQIIPAKVIWEKKSLQMVFKKTVNLQLYFLILKSLIHVCYNFLSKCLEEKETDKYDVCPTIISFLFPLWYVQNISLHLNSLAVIFVLKYIYTCIYLVSSSNWFLQFNLDFTWVLLKRWDRKEKNKNN